jgi:hypothetical protein
VRLRHDSVFGPCDDFFLFALGSTFGLLALVLLVARPSVGSSNSPLVAIELLQTHLLCLLQSVSLSR